MKILALISLILALKKSKYVKEETHPKTGQKIYKQIYVTHPDDFSLEMIEQQMQLMSKILDDALDGGSNPIQLDGLFELLQCQAEMYEKERSQKALAPAEETPLIEASPDVLEQEDITEDAYKEMSDSDFMSDDQPLKIIFDQYDESDSSMEEEEKLGEEDLQRKVLLPSELLVESTLPAVEVQEKVGSEQESGSEESVVNEAIAETLQTETPTLVSETTLPVVDLQQESKTEDGDVKEGETVSVRSDSLTSVSESTLPVVDLQQETKTEDSEVKEVATVDVKPDALTSSVSVSGSETSTVVSQQSESSKQSVEEQVKGVTGDIRKRGRSGKKSRDSSVTYKLRLANPVME